MFGNKAVPAKIIISKHMKTGFLSLILHAHLPYVRHPEHESFFEENWLFEAITECYIPLINVLDRLQKDHINYRLYIDFDRYPVFVEKGVGNTGLVLDIQVVFWFG